MLAGCSAYPNELCPLTLQVHVIDCLARFGEGRVQLGLRDENC